jgi:hypothetical protein
MDPSEAAKHAFIAYRQLTEILKDGIGYNSAAAHLSSYNRIVDTLVRCFKFDPAFTDSVANIHP